MNKLGFDALQTEPADYDAADYAGFIQNVKKSTGIDLAQYKEAQMKRRLTTLRNKNGYSSFTSFFNAMMENKTRQACVAASWPPAFGHQSDSLRLN